MKRIKGIDIFDKGCDLSVFEGCALEFASERVFFVRASDRPNNSWRGDHAHKVQRELIILLVGHVELEVIETDRSSQKVVLADFGDALLLEPFEWVRYRLSEGSLIAIVCECKFEDSPIIEDIDQFFRV